MQPTQLAQPATYANAEVRGKLRAWKHLLAQQYRTFERAYTAGCWRPLIDNFVKRSSVTGRRRAFDKLRKLFGPAPVLEGLRLGGDHPLAVWSLFKPRDSVAVNAAVETGLSQDCVTVNYLLAGVMPVCPSGLQDSAAAEGLWTMEVPDHALGRAIERSGNLLPDVIIREAHHNLLRLRQEQFEGPLHLNIGRQFLVRAGAGGFICELRAGPDVSAGGDITCKVFVRTWIDTDQIHADQILLADDGLPGHRLGDGLLLPQPMVRLVPGEVPGTFDCLAISPGLPEMLSKPQGSA
jgi:hypothetical protein